MIKQGQQLWQALNDQQQLYVVLGGACVVLLLSFGLLNAYHTTLKTGFDRQHEVYTKLLNAQSASFDFQVLKPKQAKSQIIKIAKQKGLEITLSQDKKFLTLKLENQPFSNLMDLLSVLRHQYALTNSQALITRTKSGFVNATLELNLL